MSRSVDLFIASDEPVSELAETIVARTGLTVTDRPSGAERAGSPSGATPAVEISDGRLAAVLQAHAFVDDAELLLSRYRYALSLRTTAPGHLGTSPETAFLRCVATALDDRPVLLVLDLQYRAGTPGEEAES